MKKAANCQHYWICGKRKGKQTPAVCDKCAARTVFTSGYSSSITMEKKDKRAEDDYKQRYWSAKGCAGIHDTNTIL